MGGLYRLQKKDLDGCVETLTKAFDNYPMFVHILGDKYNLENVKKFLRFLTKYTILYGEAYATSKKLEGIILYIDFKKYKFGLIRSLQSGILPVMKIGKEVGQRFMVFDEITMRVHKEVINSSHQYVILLGVNPEVQSKGLGTRLLGQVISLAKRNGQACYLETHGEKNVAFYKKQGFQVASEDEVPGAKVKQYAMILK